MRQITFILLALCVAVATVIGCGNYSETATAEGYASATNEFQDETPQEKSDFDTPDYELPSPEDMSMVLNGNWTRVTIGSSHGGELAKAHYASFTFFPDNTLLYVGTNFFKRFRAEGKYMLGSDLKTITWELTEIIEPKGDPDINSLLGSYAGAFSTHRSTGRKMIVSRNGFEFVEGMWYDWYSDCYRDEVGDAYVASGSGRQILNKVIKDDLYGLFPHEPIDYKIIAEIGPRKKAPSKIIIIPRNRWVAKGEEGYQEGIDIVVGGAKEFLREHAVPTTIPVEIKPE